MKYSNRVVIFAVAIVALAQFSTPVLADEQSDLRAKFEQRFPQIQQLKAAGSVGETTSGTVEVRTSVDGSAQSLLSAENADRHALYALIAKQENVTPEVVAVRNARRNFQKAGSGEWLKDAKGNWFQNP